VPPPDDDLDLLARHCAGHAEAFQQLDALYRERMVRFFFRLCLDRDRAEDLVQELFLKLVTGGEHYRAEGKLSLFLYRVARNLWIDHYRHAQVRPKLHSWETVPAHGGPCEAVDFAGSEATPAQSFAASDELAALRRAVACLTEPHREVVELAVYEQRPYGEISALLGIPLGTVKSRMHNAVSTLRERFGVVGVAAAGRAIERRERIGA
jgi:RNA polymerase sigma-70 factor (ECF subfamily)